MLNWILLGLAALLTLTEGGVNASASERYTFALVPNNTDSPYFDKAFEGCKKAQKETGDGVRCLYIGPGRNGGSDEQALIVHDLVANEVDGIAVAPSDVSAVAAALKAAGVKNIPIVTWNSDLSAKDTSLRAAFVGADDYQIGARIAKIILKKKPNGGVVCILAESVTEATDSKRVQGIRDVLAAKGSADEPVVRLNGQNGWREADGCPLYVKGDAVAAGQELNNTLTAQPNLDALVLADSLFELRPEVYKGIMSNFKPRLDSGRLVVVSVGTLPIQIELLREGLSSGQVGQLPFEMGYKAMYLLKSLKDGAPPPKGPLLTGVSVCTSDNVATCNGD